MAMVADAAMAVFGAGVAAPLNAADATELERAHAVEAACELLFVEMPIGLDTVFFHQAEAAIRRAVASGVDEGGPVVHIAVGFLDLVGSTTLAQELEPRALARVVSAFEQHAADVVGACGGRVVKMIGDEVMFVCPDPVAACDVALAMCEYAADDRTLPALRGALAFGDVVAAYGDFYGNTVNLAARAAKVASPGSVLVNDAIADQIYPPARLTVRTAGSHALRGFTHATELFILERA
jgi:adenylate cyclase